MMNKALDLELPVASLNVLLHALIEERVQAFVADLDAHPQDAAALINALAARLDLTEDEHRALMIQFAYDSLMAAGLGDELSRVCVQHALANGHTPA
jgi:hypothetical protein